jgi:hypothetical protein
MLPWLASLVALYLALDVANPMMPGALAFDADDSVVVRIGQRLSIDDVAGASARTTERLKPVAELVVRAQPLVRAAPRRRPHAPPRRLPPAPPAPSLDD